MATKKTNADNAATPVTTPTAQAPVQPTKKEPLYSAKDLANAARSKFGVPPEVVTVALKTAGKEKLPLDEAREIVTAFLQREVQ